jgi:hypothetical protein
MITVYTWESYKNHKYKVHMIGKAVSSHSGFKG